MNFFDTLYAKNHGEALSISHFDALFAKYISPAIDIWAEYDGTLPAQYSANGSALADYRIYGSAGGAGDKTVNIFDESGAELIDVTGDSAMRYGKNFGQIPAGTYSITYTRVGSAPDFYVGKKSGGNHTNTYVYPREREITTAVEIHEGDELYVWALYTEVNKSFAQMGITEIVLVSGSTVPAGYIPPGYEVDMGVQSANLAWTGWAQDAVNRIAYSGHAKIETINGRDCLWFSAAAGYGSYDTKYIFKTDFKENTQYVFAYEAYRPSGQTASPNVQIIYTDGTEQAIASKPSDNFEKYEVVSQVGKTIKYLTAAYYSGEIYVDLSTFMVAEGSTPLPYQPYSNITTPIYIGSSPLGEDEYVDYGEGKIYRMSGGVLTPTDPPVPLPALPTVDGTTITDYAGQSVAVPERFTAKYRKEGF